MIKDYDALFLGIQVGDDAEMTPRSQLFPVPESIEAKHSISSDYSLKAQTVDMQAITADSIADYAVTTTKLADGSVTGEKIAPQTITPDKLAEDYALKDSTPTYGSNGNLSLDGAIQIGSTDDCTEIGGTLRYNETKKTMEFCNGTGWHTLYHGPNSNDGLLPPGDVKIILGPESVCSGQTGVKYSVGNVFSASRYLWQIPSGATITNGLGTKEIVVSFGSEEGDICVAGENDNGTGAQKCIPIKMSTTGMKVFVFQTSFYVFTVPKCVNLLKIQLFGAQGESTYGIGGFGAYVAGTIDVTPGQELFVYVGGQGNTWNGGGLYGSCSKHQSYDGYCRGGLGGGSTDIRVGSTNLGDRIAIAGGGSGSIGSNFYDCNNAKNFSPGIGAQGLCTDVGNVIWGSSGSTCQGGGGGRGCNISSGASYIKELSNSTFLPGANKGDGKAIISW